MELYYPSVLHEAENETIYFRMRCRKFIEMIRRCAELSDGTPPALNKQQNDDYNGVFDHQMELDDQFGNGTKWDDGANMDISDDGGGTVLDNGHIGYSGMMQKTLDYGRLLSDEFGRDPRREVKKALEDTLAFIAYTDPRECPLSSLLGEGERVPVAEELNGAILGTSCIFLEIQVTRAYLISITRQILVFGPRAAIRPNRRTSRGAGDRWWRRGSDQPQE